MSRTSYQKKLLFVIDTFPDEQILIASEKPLPWQADGTRRVSDPDERRQKQQSDQEDSKEIGKEILCKAQFEDLYPMDEIYAWGQYSNNKKLGTFFDIVFYREKITDFWVAKWLKKTTDWRDKDICSFIVRKKMPLQCKENFFDVKKTKNILLYLQKKGVSDQTLAQIDFDFRWRWEKILQDPFVLLRYPGIQLPVVYDVCQLFSLDFSSHAQLHHLLRHILKSAYQKGHLFLPSEEMVSYCQSHFPFLEKPLSEFLKPLIATYDNRFYLPEVQEIEIKIARSLQERLQIPYSFSHESIDSSITHWEQQVHITLAPEQKQAVITALQHRITIITGGPGVGKTTTCRCITDLLRRQHHVQVAAPTGKAAKRAQESTGLPAVTLHRLLGFDGTKFSHDAQHPLALDVLIVDESSMVDAPLFAALLDALPDQTVLILVGDVDQLPSVGPGQLLSDIITSGALPVVRLTQIFRQAQESPIIQCAIQVNQGLVPQWMSHPDLSVVQAKEESEIYEQLLAQAIHLYQTHPFSDVQILIPMYRGTVGIDAVNAAVQKALCVSQNHPNALVHTTTTLYPGDKVIQTKNDYVKDIYNGDTGVIAAIPRAQTILVSFFDRPERLVSYAPHEFSQLQLAYATSVHRSQGSEYAFVLLPIVSSYGVMLQKKLFYTAITRAKKKLWIFYQPEALAQAVHPGNERKRYTQLSSLLSKSS